MTNSIMPLRPARRATDGERAKRMSIADRARQNREYVCRLLTENSPEFAAVLEWVAWELAHVSDARARCPAPRSAPPAPLATRSRDGEQQVHAAVTAGR
jgi:hypothetical protein